MTAAPAPIFSPTSARTHAYGSGFSPPDIPDEDIPAEVLAHPLLNEETWIAYRDSGRRPLESTAPVTSRRSRIEFLTGAWLIDRIVPPSLGGSLLANIQPQMLLENDTLGADHQRNGVLMPRRSSKTTTLWCIGLGRCWHRPAYMVGYTMMTTAKKAAERYRLDVRNPIVQKWRNAANRPVALISSNGNERVEFTNMSLLAILSPNGDDVRSGAYDLLILDEAGEAEPDVWGDIVAAVVPTFDTRPGAQLVLAGTGGRYRTNSYFWTILHDPRAGLIRYGVPDDVDPAELRTWDAGAGDWIERLHPGLDGLTTLEKIAANFDDLGAELFGREYLGHFGDEAGTQTAMTPGAWRKGRRDEPIPEGITGATLAVAVHPNGMWASIGIAWHAAAGPRDLASAAWELDGITDPDTERPHIGVKIVHHQRGVQGIERRLLMLARQLRTPIVYDSGAAQSRAAVERMLKQSQPRPDTTPRTLGDVKVAHVQLITNLEDGTIWHWPQAPLDVAAKVAVRQPMGQGYLIRAPKGDDAADVTPLECIALAVDALPALPTVLEKPSDVMAFGFDTP